MFVEAYPGSLRLAINAVVLLFTHIICQNTDYAISPLSFYRYSTFYSSFFLLAIAFVGALTSLFLDADTLHNVNTHKQPLPSK